MLTLTDLRRKKNTFPKLGGPPELRRPGVATPPTPLSTALLTHTTDEPSEKGHHLQVYQ